MKIYANTVTPDIDSFVGKDVWVKCRNSYNSRVCYMRFLAKEKTRTCITYEVNEIFAENHDDLLHCTWDEASHMMGYGYNYKKYECPITVVEPLDVVPSEELDCWDDASSKIIRKYVGKDIWILVRQYYKGVRKWSDPQYVRFLTNEGLLVTYVAINANQSNAVRDNQPISQDSYEELLDKLDEGENPRWSNIYKYGNAINEFEPVQPYEVLTSAEIKELADRLVQL